MRNNTHRAKFINIHLSRSNQFSGNYQTGDGYRKYKHKKHGIYSLFGKTGGKPYCHRKDDPENNFPQLIKGKGEIGGKKRANQVYCKN